MITAASSAQQAAAISLLTATFILGFVAGAITALLVAQRRR